MNDLLGSMLRDQQIAGQLRKVECRTSVCLLSLALPDMKELEKLGVAAAGGSLPRWLDLRPEDDRIVVDVYVRRDPR